MYFSLFWHILGKIQLVPKENLVEFVTLLTFKLCMSNKANKLVHRSVRGHWQKRRQNSIKSALNAKYGLKTKEKAEIFAPENCEKHGNQLKWGALSPVYKMFQTHMLYTPNRAKWHDACRIGLKSYFLGLGNSCVFCTMCWGHVGHKVRHTIGTCIHFKLPAFLHSRSLRLCISSVRFLSSSYSSSSSSSSSSVNTSKSYISDMTWPILTRLGHKCRLTIPFMSHDQIRVKGHVGVTGVKKVIFTKNATPPTNYVAWSCDLCMW